MGLLEKLWDDTVAGPHPDSGLGKLRKFTSFSPRSSSKDGEDTSSSAPPMVGPDGSDGVKVTRSIMIVKPPGYQTAGSAPVSPAGSTPPASPFSGNRAGAFRFRRRSTSDANEKEAAIEDRACRNTPPP